MQLNIDTTINFGGFYHSIHDATIESSIECMYSEGEYPENPPDSCYCVLQCIDGCMKNIDCGCEPCGVYYTSDTCCTSN